jgi:hypothetical protein
LLQACPIFPYDNSDRPCNLVGWQQFAYQAMKASESEHRAALLLLSNTQEDTYKTLIIESSIYEPDDVRQQAIAAMFKISEENINHFGHFFYLLATYNHTRLLNEKKIIRVERQLKTQINKNTKLKKQLADTQAKIQAIMDIEQDLNTN